MHDPSHLVFDIRWLGHLDVWHDEPGGADAGTVCGWSPDEDRPLGQRVRWAVRHFRHLHFRWWPYLKVRRWIVDHCAECGRRFLWKDSRTGYMGSDAVYHDTCMSLRMVRGMLDDLTAYHRGTTDSNVRWRAMYRLKKLDGSEEPNE